ncbi:MAG: hypothetical protein J3Q66DRAFT_330540 [Benniella sp.]|nr:MAG: hypothetical protein J3Q66DRAFT_330540 [Benniella sp.]
MVRVNPLDIPEILAHVGSFITVWHRDEHGTYQFRPKDMLPCTLVSRHFRNTLLPVLWYIWDERAMYSVPLSIIRTFTPYFRVHYNYGRRNDYPVDIREPCTHLLQLIIAWNNSHLGKDDIDYIRANPGLRILGSNYWFRFNTACSNPFSNFTHLERIDNYRHDSKGMSLQELFEPISGSLRRLSIQCPEGSLRLQGLVLPKMKQMHAILATSQDMIDLLEACPNLEDLESNDGSPAFNIGLDASSHATHALRSGVCPKLTSLKLIVRDSSAETFAAMLSHRTGLRRLDIRVETANIRVVNAIHHHADTLTHLTLRKFRQPTWNRSLLLGLQSILGHLEEFVIEGVSFGAIEFLADRDRWKNPGALKSLTLEGSALTYMEEEVRSEIDSLSFQNPTLHEQLRDQESKQEEGEESLLFADIRRLLSGECSVRYHTTLASHIDEWRIPQKSGHFRVHSKEFLEALFSAAEGYSRLRTITINKIRYDKVCPRMTNH